MYQQPQLLPRLKEHWSNLVTQNHYSISNNETALIFSAVLELIESHQTSSNDPVTEKSLQLIQHIKRQSYQLPQSLISPYQALAISYLAALMQT